MAVAPHMTTRTLPIVSVPIYGRFASVRVEDGTQGLGTETLLCGAHPSAQSSTPERRFPAIDFIGVTRTKKDKLLLHFLVPVALGTGELRARRRFLT